MEVSYWYSIVNDIGLYWTQNYVQNITDNTDFIKMITKDLLLDLLVTNIFYWLSY